MKVTLGGDRLGSGKKVKQELHNYFRSTHDLSQTWTSPMTVGALYPFLVIPCMRNDKFTISLDADTVTVPTKGPLFGSFKMQTDLFFCPVRLYQAILHNNPTNIGLKMNQVMLPTYELSQVTTSRVNNMTTPINNSALWKYLGLSGLGKGGKQTTQQGQTVKIMRRKFNAVPMLAYYDIFKNYYSNKQEENAYVIGTKEVTVSAQFKTLNIGGSTLDITVSEGGSVNLLKDIPTKISVIGNFLDKYPRDNEDELIQFIDSDETLFDTIYTNNILQLLNNNIAYSNAGGKLEKITANADKIEFWFTPVDNVAEVQTVAESEDVDKYVNFGLYDFPLKNIDDMRMAVLSHHTLGTSFDVSGQYYLPYEINDMQGSLNPLNGLVVKTYQSDIFNNWVNTEWIDGENGIAEITKIATSDGAFKLDQLNLAEKLYNMLNRVAVSGGTYEDWQDAVYDEAPHKHIESPIYLGGMSSEIVFEQIVANTAAQTDAGEQPLGDLAGRGRYIKRKGGHVSCKCDEAGYIIGIVSITPRIKYTQGNEFYLTDIMSLDDMHKPALDGIGFQNLIGERLAWFDTTQNTDGTYERSVVGKLPAWMEYMTAVDKTYGDFAELDGKAFMSLNRNYEMDDTGDIADLTTYIDPTKYNYAFANTALDAQNFWTEIHSNIIARRKMSAKQIPNL